MQAPGTLNLTCYQGASFDRTLTWKIDGLAVNLTGYTARMQVRTTYSSATTALSLTSGSGITLGGAAGTILIEISATTTSGLTEGQYVYDLELVSSTGSVTRLVEGTFIVDPEVTK
jgi:hypothetical protein